MNTTTTTINTDTGIIEMTYTEGAVEVTLYATKGHETARGEMVIDTALIIVPTMSQLHDMDLMDIYDNAVRTFGVISPLSRTDKRNLGGKLIIQVY